MSVTTTEALRQPTDAEREFIDGVAAYYQMNDGMPLARGRLIGWLVICDPPTQSARSLSAKVGCDESDVDYILGLLVPSGVLQRSEAPDPDDFLVKMDDTAWPERVKAVFANIPVFHEILQQGCEALAEAPAERRRRIESMERLFGYLSVEIPAVIEAYEQRSKEPMEI